MRSREGVVTAYVLLVGVAAAVAVGSATIATSVAVTSALVAAVMLSEAVATDLRQGVRVSLTNVVLLVAVLIDGPGLAAVAALGGFPVFLWRATGTRVIRATFNTAQYVLCGWVAGALYQVLTEGLGASFPEPLTLFAALAAALVYSVVNHGLVAGVVSLSTSDRFFETFRTIGPSLLMQVPYVGIAVLTVVVLDRASAWALVLMAVPALVARYGLLAFQQLDRSYDQLVRNLVKTIEIKDLYTRGHSERVADLSVAVAEELGVGYEERRVARYAALLHDVGKIGVPLCVINKSGPLDDDEFEEMKRHPTIGADILRDIHFLEPAIDIVRYHHERLDGRGYPHGVDERELSGIVRIVTAVDAFDAMTSTRPYRRAMPVEDGIAELRRCAGTQFDPEVVEALARCVVRLDWTPTDMTPESGEVPPNVGVTSAALSRLEGEDGRSGAQVQSGTGGKGW